MAADTSSRTTPLEHPVTNSKGADLKQERALRTRGKVLDAAAQAFAAKGFPGVTMLDIAELSGMTKGAVYFHFANKEALALAVVEEFYQRLSAVVAGVRQLGLPPLAEVVELFTRTAAAFRDDKVIQAGARLQIEHAYIDADLPLPYTDFGKLVTETLTHAKDSGQLPEGTDPEVVSRVLVAGFFGAQHMSWVLNDRNDLQERIQEILDAVLPAAH
jgi:AcrR family transcriptional regulator